MSRCFQFSILFLLFLIIISKNCLATDGSILQAENSFSIGTGLLNLQYGETISGFSGYLDTENGDINTIIIEWTGLANDNADGNRRTFLGMRIFPGAYFSGKIIYADANTEYDGYTLSGTPISTTDLATFLKANIAFGKSIKLSDRVILIPTINAGIHNWKRVSNPYLIVGGVNYESDEIYRHLNAGIGLKSDIRILEQEVLSLGIDVLQNFNSNMTSSYTANNYELGNSVTLRVNGKITIEPAKNVNLYGAIDFETFNYGKSDIASNGFLEPDSKTSITLYSVGVAYAY
jgi:hypothetical protein